MLYSENYGLAIFKGVKFIFIILETCSSLDIENIPKGSNLNFLIYFFWMSKLLKYIIINIFVLGESEELWELEGGE